MITEYRARLKTCDVMPRLARQWIKARVINIGVCYIGGLFGSFG